EDGNIYADMRQAKTTAVFQLESRGMKDLMKKVKPERFADIVAQAGHIFGLMEMFAGYGFNKPHSVAYALIAYQTAWLKHYFPADFMAAVQKSK
ncbi:MAG: hypothetical protein ACNYPE_17885, partial [Candidatus Azotimanducaceae bacterium WSBS_2022_MAG_OTU7]